MRVFPRFPRLSLAAISALAPLGLAGGALALGEVGFWVLAILGGFVGVALVGIAFDRPDTTGLQPFYSPGLAGGLSLGFTLMALIWMPVAAIPFLPLAFLTALIIDRVRVARR